VSIGTKDIADRLFPQETTDTFQQRLFGFLFFYGLQIPTTGSPGIRRRLSPLDPKLCRSQHHNDTALSGYDIVSRTKQKMLLSVYENGERMSRPLYLSIALLMGCVPSEKPDVNADTPTTDTSDEETDDTTDVDGDGFTEEEDCDDNDDAVNPDAEETCDGIDNDCDGLVDDEDDSPTGQTPWFTDEDGDGFGDDSTQSDSCEEILGQVGEGGDCDDRSILLQRKYATTWTTTATA
jgi:hypothetical protein